MSRRLEGLTFFVDRSLGSKVVAEALRAEGAVVEVHDCHFPQTEPDAAWIRAVSSRGWVILSRDEKIVRRHEEKEAARESKARIFLPAIRKGKGPDFATVFVEGLPAILRHLDRYQGPFVVRVYPRDRAGRTRTSVVGGLVGKRLRRPAR